MTSNEKMREDFEASLKEIFGIDVSDGWDGEGYTYAHDRAHYKLYQFAYTTALADEQAIRAEIRAKVVEECAAVCDAEEAHHKELIAKSSDKANKLSDAACANLSRWLAKAIRALAVREGV